MIKISLDFWRYWGVPHVGGSDDVYFWCSTSYCLNWGCFWGASDDSGVDGACQTLVAAVGFLIGRDTH